MATRPPDRAPAVAQIDAATSHEPMGVHSADTYLAYWRERRASALRTNERLAQQARGDAAHIAGMLRARFGVSRVVLFGSLVRGRFHAASDIDLAVEGLAPGDYFPALALAAKLSVFPIDLKPLEDLAPHFRARILITGEEI